jgi:hypothetical protein
MPIPVLLKNNRVLAILMAGTALLFLLLHYAFRLSANLSILTLTLIAIIWYSWETRGMKVQIVKQNELAIRPFVIQEKDVIGEAKTLIHFRNIGNGPAFNITIEEVKAVDESGEELDIRFSDKDLLRAGESVTASGTDYRDWHLAFSAPRIRAFKLMYFDLNNKRYFTSGRLGNNRFLFTGTGAA